MLLGRRCRGARRTTIIPAIIAWPLLAIPLRLHVLTHVNDRFDAEQLKRTDHGGRTRMLPTATAAVMIRCFGCARVLVMQTHGHFLWKSFAS